MPLAQPSTASAKAKSDVTQYALIGVILLAALGIVLLPDGAGLETSSQSTIRLPDLLNELGQLPDESVSSGGPTMGEIRNQLWDGYRSQGSPTSARKHYARAMELLMMRVVTSPANDQAPAPDPIQAKYRAPVRFRTELEYKIYDYLRGQLKAK